MKPTNKQIDEIVDDWFSTIDDELVSFDEDENFEDDEEEIL